MKKRGPLTVIALISFLSLFLASYSFAQQTEIKMGFQGVLSGVAAAIGDGARKGAEFAVSQTNKAGGIKGAQIKLIVIDDKANPNDAVEAAQRLIEAEKVVAIVNGGTSTTFLASSKVAEKAKVPMVGHIQSDPEITKRGNAYAFRICVNAAGLAYPIAEYAIKDLKLKKIAIMNRNDGYGNSIAEAFTKKVRELGGEITTVQSYAPGTKDFKANLIKARETKPDGLMLTGFFDDSGLITRQTREIGMKVQILGQNTMSDPGYVRIAGTAAEGAILSSNYVAGVLNSKGAENFEKEWKQKYNETPGSYAAHGYDAAMAIIEAIKHGSANSESIRSELLKLKNFDGASGYVNKFRPNGDVDKVTPVVKIVKGKLVHLKTYMVKED
jgi:branched-chain amino acid transport system substrate-binding protein